MELDKKSDELAEIKQFLMLSTHEMRTYLTANKWLLVMLEHGELGALTGEQQSLIVKAHQANEKALSLLNNILTSLKTNQANATEILTSVILNDLIAETLTLLSIEAQRKLITFSFVCDEDVVVFGK